MGGGGGGGGSVQYFVVVCLWCALDVPMLLEGVVPCSAIGVLCFFGLLRLVVFLSCISVPAPSVYVSHGVCVL